MQYNSVDHFVEIQENLLKLEQETEVSEQKSLYENQSFKALEKRGVCLRNLSIDQQRTGMYGRLLITFSIQQSKKTDGLDNETTSHRIGPGDIVGVYLNKMDVNTESLATGIVSYVKAKTVTVAFNEDFEINTNALYCLMILTNDVTYRRLKKALKEMKKVKTSRSAAKLLDVLFPCNLATSRCTDHAPEETTFLNEQLDQSQKDAVEFVMKTTHAISVIHGPPGTGKSTTVVEAIHQAVTKYSMKVLACAPSNIAVDNLVEKLHKTGLKVVRLGHPARVIKEVQNLSLDAILTSRDSSEIIRSVRGDIYSVVSKLKKCKNKADSFAIKKQLKELRKELSTREDKAMMEVLRSADVILSTTTSSSYEGPLHLLNEDHFDLLVIDEAAQAMELSCWIPLLQSPRCILAGDHKQLPPTIISEEAAKKGLAVTLLERVVHGIGENVVCMLTNQYRMNEKIMKWSSQTFYKNKLTAADSVAHHLLCDLPGVKRTENTSQSIIFTDTAGCNMHELNCEDEQSKGNSWEVGIITSHIETLVDAGVKMGDIGVITPYNLQVDMLRKNIHPTFPNIEINSVDGFQGREKEAILISMVRSNDNGEVGFLSEYRRINVAITRARRHLFVTGDSFTISKDRFLKSLCSYFHENAELRSAGTSNHGHVSNGGNIIISTKEFELPDCMLNKAVKNEEQKNLCSEQLVAQSELHPVTSKVKSYYGDQTAAIKMKTVPGPLQVNVVATEEKRKSDLKEKLESFLKSNEKELHLPHRLTSKERAYCHELAEQMNLSHISSGNAESRKLLISKKIFAEPDSNLIDTRKECKYCKKLIEITNFELHAIHCERLGRVKNDINSEKSVQCKKKKEKKRKEISSSTAVDDDDILLDMFARENSSCLFDKCKSSIKTCGQKCEFCSQMFCLKHHLAEIHGCGNAARIKAQQDIAKYRGSAPRPMNDVKKAQIKKKLSNKINGLEDGRQKKKDKK